MFRGWTAEFEFHLSKLISETKKFSGRATLAHEEAEEWFNQNYMDHNVRVEDTQLNQNWSSTRTRIHATSVNILLHFIENKITTIIIFGLFNIFLSF